MKWIERTYYYLQGRYGRFDEFTKFLLLVGIIVFAINGLVNTWILNSIGIGFIAYGLLRPASKEVDNRRKELRTYLGVKEKVMTTFNRGSRKFSNAKTRGFKNPFKRKNTQNSAVVKVVVHCPNCQQKLRVPTGKTLNIKCSSCQYQFQQRT